MGLNIQGCFGQNLVYFSNAIGIAFAERGENPRVELSAGGETKNRANPTNAEGPPLEERRRLL